MTAYEKKMIKIIIKAKHDMSAVKETIEMEKESLRQNLREKYPYDYYGIKADLIFEEKSKKIEADLKRVNLYCTALAYMTEDVEGEML